MKPNLWWILVAAALVGHFGLHLALYNRLNSFGLSRRTIKRIEKALFVEMLVTPPLLAWWYFDLFADVWFGRVEGLEVPTFLAIYGSVCLGTWIAFGIPWLLWRPIFGLEWVRAPRTVEVVDVQRAVGRSLARTRQCYWESRLPLNQIFDLAVEQIRLPVARLPSELDGYRIAQISDVHLTGDVEPDYVRYVVQRALAWQPELMAITGDIIDAEPCIDWLGDLFGPAEAPDGCFFILGNHDTRVPETDAIRRSMAAAGWTDLGARSLRTTLRQTPSLLIGNEHPWFRRPDWESPDASRKPREAFRLLLSHSPDQIGWARRRGVHLMLAGHTHGGQGRLPLAGPLLSPSWHGSRFASGDFFKPPTTLHVSRGLAGVHLMRINCRPELSLITLQAMERGQG